jgi:thioredoxin 1
MDEELQRIREKKLRELQDGLQRPKTEFRVHSVDSTNFQSMLKTHRFLVVDFWAEWCGPCRRGGPVVEELARELGDRVTFAKCNTDQNPSIASGFGINAIPTIILFSSGKVADMVVGALPKETLKARLFKAFGLQE